MYRADDKRYETMTYNRCGYSGLKLPAVSLLSLIHISGVSADASLLSALLSVVFPSSPVAVPSVDEEL